MKPFEPYFKQINTMSKSDIDIRAKIEKLLSKLHPAEQIDIVESLGKKYRRANSIRINHGQMGRRVEIRPDEILMKE